ncbi:MAG: bluetail domain-containing putative surface protein [Nostoc sp. DedSLP01]|nr:bluetail domain-containing putative surface protein [Nostoc sp. DedSLP05]MDZ8103248.1 bluetail domain-containing putative surface protein [Nostoc sp. DedSLP01]
MAIALDNISSGLKIDIGGIKIGDISSNSRNGSGGNDIIFGLNSKDNIDGKQGNDILYGKDGNDTLLGGSGNDILLGGDGNDKLVGGTGADKLTGGKGKDSFGYTELTDSLWNNYDRITDFSIGTDSIDGPYSVNAAGVFEKGGVLTGAWNPGKINGWIGAVLAPKKAVTFQYKANGSAPLQTFVALNDNIAGFQSGQDAIIEITGYSGNLTNLTIV